MTEKPDVFLVTGADGGLGRAIVAALVERGWGVLATDLAAASDLDEAGGRVRYVSADVRDAEQMTAAVAAAEPLGRLAGCVANAGILAEDFSATVEASPEAWRKTFEVNAIGVLNTLQATARVLTAQDGGRMTAMASIAGLQPQPNIPAYSASKAAVIAIVRSLALELGPAGITVNAVAPGPVATRAQQRLVGERQRGVGGAEETAAQRFQRHQAEDRPISRMATPAEVAEAFAWLLSDAAAYVTGQVLAVDGGATLR